MKLCLSRPPDPATHVSSAVVGYYYRCATIAEVDENLAEVRRSLGPYTALTESAQSNAWLDIDALLSRRLFLMETAEAV